MTRAAHSSADASLLHRLWPGFKLAVLFIFSLVLFVTNRLEATAAALAVTLALYALAGFSFQRAWQQIRPIWWLFVILFVF